MKVSRREEPVQEKGREKNSQKIKEHLRIKIILPNFFTILLGREFKTEMPLHHQASPAVPPASTELSIYTHYSKSLEITPVDHRARVPLEAAEQFPA